METTNTTETTTATTSTELQINVSQRAIAVFEAREFTMPHHQEQMIKIKHLAAALWTEIDNITLPPGNSEPSRLMAMAKDNLETGVMQAVKALTRFTPSKFL